MKKNQKTLSVILTVLVSIITLIILSFFKKISPIESTIISMLAIIIGLMLEIFFQLEEKSNLNQMYYNFKLQLSKNEQLEGIMETNFKFQYDIMRKYSKNHLIHGELMHCTSDYKNKLEYLSKGKVSKDENSRIGYMTNLLKATKKGDNVKTVSYVDINNWWYSPSGKKYLQENYHAIKRDVNICRIFIVKKGGEDLISTFAKQQNERGVRVYLVDEQFLTNNKLKQNFLLINDNYLSYSLSKGNNDNKEGVISVDNDEIEEYNTIFSELESNAIEYETYFLSHPPLAQGNN